MSAALVITELELQHRTSVSDMSGVERPGDQVRACSTR